jgi:hypothetical protein
MESWFWCTYSGDSFMFGIVQSERRTFTVLMEKDRSEVEVRAKWFPAKLQQFSSLFYNGNDSEDVNWAVTLSMSAVVVTVISFWVLKKRVSLARQQITKW